MKLIGFANMENMGQNIVKEDCYAGNLNYWVADGTISQNGEDCRRSTVFCLFVFGFEI